MTHLDLKCDYTYTDAVLIDALSEDIGNGDITTSALIPENHISSAVLIAKSDFIVAGIPFAERTFKLVNLGLRFKTIKSDGSAVKADAVIAKISGNTRSLLMAERVALNLLQRLSGIATLTNKFVKSARGLAVKIVDTRKTTPGFRYFEKYAVRVGGGYNHRYGLSDGVLIKDNHIVAVGSLGKAIKLARVGVHHLLKIEVEVKNIKEVKEALSAGADVIMLDNMSVDEIKRAVNIIRHKNRDVVIEVSGNINLKDIPLIANTGVDLISIGLLTHSAPAADISMRIVSD